LKHSGIIRSIVGSTIIGIVIFVLLISLAPDATPFSSNNYGYNGMQQVDSTYNIHPINSLFALTANNNTVLLIIAPTSYYTSSDASAALSFVEGGGTLVISDGTGFANSLLANMSAGIFITQDRIQDPLYNSKSPSFPIALVGISSHAQYPFLANVSALAMNSPSSITVTTTKASVLAYSSPYSYSLNYTNTIGSKGPFPMIAAEHIGKGKLIVIGTSTFFTNSVWKNADNSELAKNILSNKTVYIDTSHWPLNTGESLKAQFLSAYSELTIFPLRYLFALGAFAVTASILPVFSFASKSDSRGAMEETTKKYDERIMEKIRRDRKRYGMQTANIRENS
jgi:hypothetical protein